MIRLDTFLQKIHELGVTTPDSELKDQIPPSLMSEYVIPSEARPLVTYCWKKLTDYQANELICMLFSDCVPCFTAKPLKVPTHEEWNQFFDDIQKRVENGEKGIYLSGEMQKCGFLPVNITGFDFSNRVFRHLIIDIGEFHQCDSRHFEKCYMPSHFFGTSLISLNEFMDVIGQVNTITLVQLLVRLRDYHLLREFVETDFTSDGSAIWLELAILCANLGIEIVHIHKFNLGLNELERVILEYAKRDLKELLKYFHEFKIKDEKQLLRLGLAFAKCSKSTLAENIQKLGIQNQDTLVQIARACVVNCHNFPHFIPKFNIKDENVLLELAEACIKYKSWLFPFLKNFKIKDRDKLIEFAMKCAQTNARSVALYLKEFEIQDEEVLIALALECAKEAPGILLSKFPSNIRNQKALIEIANQCMLCNAFETAQEIHHLKIEDENTLFDIAMKCIQQCDIIFNIKNFKIKDQEKLILLAKAGAQFRPQEVFNHIDVFNIKDESVLITIAKMCIKFSGLTMLHNFSDVVSANGLIEITKFGIKYGAYQIKYQSFHQNDNDCAEVFLYYYGETPRHFDEMPVYPNQNIKGFDLEKITLKNKFAQEQTDFWRINAVSILNDLTTAEQCKWINETRILDHIQRVDDPKLRWKLTYCLYKFVQTNHFECYEIRSCMGDLTGKLKKAEKAQCLIELIRAILKQRKVFFEFNPKIFIKDTVKLNEFLKAFSRLVVDKNISNDRLQQIIEEVFQDPMKYLSRLSVFYDLCEEELLVSNQMTLDDLLKKAFQNKFDKIITLIDDNDVEKFHNLSKISRNPEALSIYITRLNTAHDPKIKTALQDLLQIVLHGDLSESRYDTSRNVHLKKIEEHFPDVLQKWKVNREVPLAEMKKLASRQERVVDLKAWMFQKLVIDKHLPEDQLPYLIPYLKGKITSLPQNCSQIEKLCVELLENSPEKLVELKQLVAGTEFENDIQSLFFKERKITDNAVVVDTDNFIDILLCGTDVQGSCQRVNGEPGNNKGLLGYLLNGQVRLLAVKVRAGPQGMIQARCLLRLLWDGVKSKPVLFRERFYPSTIAPEMEAALTAVAKEKATSLGLDLLCLGTSYPNPIESLGGRAPYEYVDACGGIREGYYQIKWG